MTWDLWGPLSADAYRAPAAPPPPTVDTAADATQAAKQLPVSPRKRGYLARRARVRSECDYGISPPTGSLRQDADDS